MFVSEQALCKKKMHIVNIFRVIVNKYTFFLLVMCNCYDIHAFVIVLNFINKFC